MTTEAVNVARDEAEDGRGGQRLEDTPVSTPTPDEDERLRGLIRAELDRQHAMPIARRTLELLAEADAEPIQDEPGYRVIDRNGETRLLRDRDAGPDDDANDVTSPLTLRDLVAELRERYPDLFSTPPEPEAVDPIPPPPPEPAHDSLAEVKAAGAHFVETQTTLAKSFAASSAERGRALANAASKCVEGWRMQLGEKLKADSAPTPVEGDGPVEPVVGTMPPISASELGEAVADERVESRDTNRRITERVSTGAFHLGDFIRHRRDALSAFHLGDHVTLPRAVFAGLATATFLAIMLAVMTSGRHDTSMTASEPAPSNVEASRPSSSKIDGASDIKGTPQDVPGIEARNDNKPMPARPEAKPTPPELDPAPEDDPEAGPVDDAPRNPNDVAGIPEVIDTATLKLSGKVIHLFGVEWVRGAQSEELTKYLRGRSVTCRPAAGSSAFLCSVEGRDLSEVVLFNGGGRASSEASPDLVAAEDHARSERLGVWKR